MGFCDHVSPGAGLGTLTLGCIKSQAKESHGCAVRRTRAAFQRWDLGAGGGGGTNILEDGCPHVVPWWEAAEKSSNVSGHPGNTGTQINEYLQRKKAPMSS